MLDCMADAAAQPKKYNDNCKEDRGQKSTVCVCACACVYFDNGISGYIPSYYCKSGRLSRPLTQSNSP